MPIQIQWLEPQILYYQLVQPFTREELDASIDEALTMARMLGDQEVGTLLDVSGLSFIPSASIQHGLETVRKKPANANFIVVLGAKPFARTFYHLASTMFPALQRWVAFADDLDGGKILLKSMMEQKASALKPQVSSTPDLSTPIEKTSPSGLSSSPVHPAEQERSISPYVMQETGMPRDPETGLPLYKTPETTDLYVRIRFTPETMRAWQQTVLYGLPAGEIQYLAEQFVKIMDPTINLNRIDWDNLITDLFMVPEPFETPETFTEMSPDHVADRVDPD